MLQFTHLVAESDNLYEMRDVLMARSFCQPIAAIWASLKIITSDEVECGDH